MENSQLVITAEEHAYYEKLKLVHEKNNTLNHVEDSRSVWAIINAGLEKIGYIDLKSIIAQK